MNMIRLHHSRRPHIWMHKGLWICGNFQKCRNGKTMIEAYNAWRTI